jgi:amino acid transporter
MSEILILTAVIGFFIVILGILFVLMVLKKKKEGIYKEPDYRIFFILGISFLAVGIVMMIVIKNPGFIGITALGLIYMTIGLAHHDKWKSP